MKPPLAIIATMAASTVWGQPQQFEELGRRALDAARAGRYPEAVGAYEQMLKIDPIAKVRAVAAKADLRLVGIGQMDQRAQVHIDGFVSRGELFDMMRLGAVGELTGWAFDAKGRIIDGGTNQRLTSIPPQVPAKALTIGAAVGPAKVPAIAAALKGRLINGLVTDETTASAILKQQ